MIVHIRTLGLLTTLAAMAWACGGSETAQTPSAPTAVGAATTAGTTAGSGTTTAPNTNPGHPPPGDPENPSPGGPGNPPPPGGPGDHPGVFGTVSGLSGSCPSLTFVLGGKTIRTNADTRFDDSACTDIENGVQAGAQGTLQADGTLVAEHVRVGAPPEGPGPNGPPPGDPEDPPPGGPGDRPGAFGTVSGLTGSCPSLTFTLDGKTVRTDAGTRFDDSACTDVKNGVHAGAQGTLQTDGGLLAGHVRVGDPPRR